MKSNKGRKQDFIYKGIVHKKIFHAKDTGKYAKDNNDIFILPYI